MARNRTYSAEFRRRVFANTLSASRCMAWQGDVHMLKTGERWRDRPPEYGPYTTIHYHFNRRSKQGVWEDVFHLLTGPSGVAGTTSADSTYIKAHHSGGVKRGDYADAIGRSRCGHTTEVHALTDEAGRPLALSLTPGQAHDLVGLGEILRRVSCPKLLFADRAYDARKLRAWLAERGLEAVIPPNITRKRPHSWDRAAYRARNVIERMFCRLKDFRRIATRYDKRADTHLSAVLIAATVTWWLN